jgi:hypothetical protein
VKRAKSAIITPGQNSQLLQFPLRRARHYYGSNKERLRTVSNIIPLRPNLRADVDEAAITEQVEQIPGELNMDRVIKAQLSAPQIARRITELEECLLTVAQELLRYEPRSASAERARLLLKNRLEINVEEIE